MSRPAIVYLSMLLIFIAGLWVVLVIGAHRSAPEDLAGKWQLQSKVRGIPDDELSIEQSGRFFQVSFASGPNLDLELTDPAGSPLKLTGGDNKLIVSGAPDSDDRTIELAGNSVGRWSAHRLIRTYPADSPAKENH